MSGEDRKEKILRPLEAAHYLGITSELLFQYTKKQFSKTSGIRKLETIERAGSTFFSISELKEFDQLLAGKWPSVDGRRVPIPTAILNHLRSESLNQCARCGSGIGVDTAHIKPWAESQSHHHANLIRICSACHREHDSQNSLSTAELKALKDSLVTRVRTNLSRRMQNSSERSKRPRPVTHFFGRDPELSTLVDALRTGQTILITGVGGIGKTELLLQALNVADTERPVLWIDVELYRTSEDVLSALRSLLGNEGVACSEENVVSRLNSLQACVIFDGIERTAFVDIETFENELIALYDTAAQAQFVITSQVALLGLAFDTRLQLGRLDTSASQYLLESFHPIGSDPNCDDITPLLEFCEGHALTLRLAAALRGHYGGANMALSAINANGIEVISLPARKRHTPRTSLELCLQTAYGALSNGAQVLLWALSEAPAGFFTHFIEKDFLELGSPLEALAELRRWNLIESYVVHKSLTRTQVLSPIRAFAIQSARNYDPLSHSMVIDRIAHALQMMVAVFEIKYDDPDQTPYVISRYEEELPNFIHLLELARDNVENAKLGGAAVSIITAMMRYFFVRRLPEQGARVMHDAAELAIAIGKANQASGLVLQMMSLATRAEDMTALRTALLLVDKLEKKIDDIEAQADLAMCRAIVGRTEDNYLAAERYSRSAFNGYRSILRTAVSKEDNNSDAKDKEPVSTDHIHNQIANALGLLGFSLLSQKRYDEARKAFIHSLSHERGGSVGVNRGQILHQIGNCECHLGRFKEAAKLYVEAAGIFHFVGMEEYLSSALSELGYALLDIEDTYPLDELAVETIEAGLSDLERDIFRVFDPDYSVDHTQAVGIIRKTFGNIALVSLSGRASLLGDFSMALADNRLRPIGEQIAQGGRDQDEGFPLLMMDVALRLGFYAAQAERVFAEEGDISRDIISEMLKTICNSGNWARETMRIVDWLSALLARRWEFEGVGPDRLREFVQNYDDDVIDYLDLDRRT